ncbi:MAG: replication-associated recombination protein A [Clostridia bacterium]|nr:replication-associated recombination protein A [Clostridia bacterium]
MSHNTPAPDRLRPVSFDEVAGQKHLVGERGVLRRLCDRGHITSMIFFGPPGTGKTTCASIIAERSGMEMRRLNATTASLSDVKAIAAETSGVFGQNGILLYLDEIQYFNKKQQQSLLEYLEDGRITLIASTTENPYYYIYDALLSRCSVFEFKPVSAEDMMPRLRTAAGELCKNGAEESALQFIARAAAGDVRRGLTMLDSAAASSEGKVTEEDVKAFLPSVMAGVFDADADVHYNLLSCLQKSIRGSDPDAAVFYLAKLLEGGDLLSPCRRLLVIASEDIGAAYPMAAAITYACVESAKMLGLPEARIPLANATVMLATAPKSNTAYTAVNEAAQDIREGKGLNIPEHLKSPLFKGYVYPHDFPNDWTPQQYLPDDLKDKEYYRFGENKTEQAAKRYWDEVKKKK